MNDRELLELAAKAAGIEIDDDGAPFVRNYSNEYGNTCDDWNPLTNDGDALRLAVKLRIHIEWTSTLTKHKEEWINTFPKSLGHLSELTYLGDDPYAATRRAIVLVAAEIGKAMP